MVIFKLLYLSYMPNTLYFSYFHSNGIAMLYLVHKCKKKLESTNMDLTHSKIIRAWHDGAFAPSAAQQNARL